MTNQDKNNDNLTPSNQGKINKYSSDLIKKGLDLARSIQNNLLDETNTEEIFDPDYYESKADELFSQGKYQEALIYYEKSSHSGDCKILFFHRGRDLVRLYEYEMALQYFDKSIEIETNYFSHNPDHWIKSSSWIAKAEVLTEMGYYQEALNCYDTVVGFYDWPRSPGLRNAWEGKAKLFRDKLGSFEDALYYYDKLLEIYNLGQGYWNQKIDLLLELGRFEEVDYTYSQNIENVQKEEVQLKLKLYNEENESDVLYSFLYNKALEFSLWVARADEVLVRLAKYEDAITYCDNALNIYEESQKLYESSSYKSFDWMLSYTEERNENFDEWFEDLLGWDSIMEEIWQGDARGGWLQLFVSIRPHGCLYYSLTRNNIRSNLWDFRGFLLVELKRYEEAIESYNESLKIQPDQPKIWFNKGQIFFNMNMYDDALYCYDQALIVKPKNSDFLKRKADTLKLLNRWIEVFECHQKIKEIEPDFIDT